MNIRYFTLILCLLGTGVCYAQHHHNQEAGERVDTLETSVVSAHRHGGTLSRGQDLRTEIINSAGLMKMACCNLAESFENSAAVTVGYADAATGARQIRLLGLSGIYTQMLDESRPILHGLSSPFGLSYIPGPWLESIQIAKGSPSVVSGPDSMTGQINVEHRKPTDEIPFFFNASMMSDSRLDANVASSLTLSPSLYTVTLGHAEANFKDHDMNMDGFLDEPRARQFAVQSRWLYYIPEIQVRWGVGAVSDSRKGGQVGGGWQTDIRNRQLNAYLKVGRPLREDQSASVALVADYTHDRLDGAYGQGLYTGRQNSVFANLIYHNQFSEAHDLTAGASASWDRYDESLFRPLYVRDLMAGPGPLQRSELLHGGPYGEYTFHVHHRFNLVAGLRGEWYRGAGFRLVPRITLKLEPAESLILRANAGRGLREALPLIDHLGVLSTGKLFAGDYLTHQLEDAWTFGGNATWYFAGESNYFSLDFFSTRFADQLIVDYEQSPLAIAFYPLEGKSYSNSWQADLHAEPFERFTVDLTARYTDAKSTFRGAGLRDIPLSPNFKGVLALQYKTRLSRWIFDFTAALNGSARVYDFMKDLRGDDGQLLYPGGRTPVYPQLFAQVTRRFKGFDIYVGGENLTNFRQQKVILGFDRGTMDQFVPQVFDASAVWGPIMGLKINAGIRVTIWQTY